jgi:phosphatidylglycerol:prolipoprotein diacylglycerol transferase
LYPYLNLFGRAIPTYGLLLVFGAVAAWLMIWVLARAKRTYTGDVPLVFLLGLCGAMVGAVALRPLMKIVEVALAWEQYRAVSAEALLGYVFGEVVFYGGLLGGAAGIVLFCRKFRLKTLPLLDLFAPGVALAHAVGRVGCFLAGCCYGVEVPRGSRFSVVYPAASLGAPPDVPRLAVPLIEAAFLLLLSAALVAVYWRGRRAGLCVTVYAAAYAAERFVLEFYRGDLLRGQYGGLSTSQYISVGLFVCAAVFFILQTYSRRRAA